MNVSQNCIDLIRSFEGFEAHPYKCPSGIWTIGFGSTFDTDGTPITEDNPPITVEHATSMMLANLVPFEAHVNSYVTAYINQNQFDALVDFAYNCGAQNLRTSTLLKLLNEKDYKGASSEFNKWIYGGGRILAGLVKRRLAEQNLFNS